jgi:hypothetical protein
MESGGEGSELWQGCAPLLYSRGGSGGVGRWPVVVASMPAVSALKEKGGQWGGEAIRWGKLVGRRACHGGGRRAAGRPGRQHAAAPDRGGGSVLLDWRKEKAS